METDTLRIDLWALLGCGKEGEGGMYGESNMETYITVCKIDSQWEFTLWLRELKPAFRTTLEGWDGDRSGMDVQMGEDMDKPMADSC